MRATENEKRDWAVIALILLLGLLWILLAGGWALRFTPLWELDTNVESKIDPNRDFLTRKPEGFIEPVDAAILTNPAWMNGFLTPGASISTATPFPTSVNISFTTSTSGTLVTTQTATPAATTTALATNTALASPTNTFVYFPPPPSSTPRPNSGSTSIAPSSVPPTTTSTSTPSPMGTISQTSTLTAASVFTNSPTHTPTATFTSTATFTNTLTNTPTATGPSFCTTTIIITGTSGSYAKPGGSTCFQYTDAFANGGIFQITSTGVNGSVDGSSCSGKSISNGATIDYGVAQSGGLMLFRITGTAGTVDINISDWTTYPICP